MPTLCLRLDTTSLVGVSCGPGWYAGHQVPLLTNVKSRLPMTTPGRFRSGELESSLVHRRGATTRIIFLRCVVRAAGMLAARSRWCAPFVCMVAAKTRDMIAAGTCVMALKSMLSSSTSASGCSLGRTCTGVYLGNFNSRPTRRLTIWISELTFHSTSAKWFANNQASRM